MSSSDSNAIGTVLVGVGGVGFAGGFVPGVVLLVLGVALLVW